MEPEEQPAKPSLWVRYRWLLRVAFQGVVGAAVPALCRFAFDVGRADVQDLIPFVLLVPWSACLAHALTPPPDDAARDQFTVNAVSMAVLAPVLVALCMVWLESLRMLSTTGLSQGLPFVNILRDALNDPAEVLQQLLLMGFILGTPIVILGVSRANEHVTRDVGISGVRAAQYLLAGLCFCFPLFCLLGVDLGGKLFDGLFEPEAGDGPTDPRTEPPS